MRSLLVTQHRLPSSLFFIHISQQTSRTVIPELTLFKISEVSFHGLASFEVGRRSELLYHLHRTSTTHVNVEPHLPLGAVACFTQKHFSPQSHLQRTCVSRGDINGPWEGPAPASQLREHTGCEPLCELRTDFFSFFRSCFTF